MRAEFERKKTFWYKWLASKQKLIVEPASHIRNDINKNKEKGEMKNG